MHTTTNRAACDGVSWEDWSRDEELASRTNSRKEH